VINNRYSLIDAEVKTLDEAIEAYNQIIVKKANEYGFALADMYQYFKKVKSGIKWNGVDYNLTFVSGGFLSLDGYHPNQKGYGLIANEFIKVINDKYKANVPQTNCKTCDGVLFN
jgi:lysophospholipase L1-like esterase